MERFTISKSEKQTIYEIYRACRICGAGGGYRMPIIQNIIDLETSDVELRQKVQECLQLEVRPDDRMPPLICELCVDKVNDFYEFFNLARQTNVRTRTRLGLPVQTAKKGEPDPTDCILGVTEPVYVKDDNSSSKRRKAGPKSSKNIKKEPETVNVKTENPSESSSRSSSASRSSRAAPSPPPPPPSRRSRAAPPPAPPAPPPLSRPGPKSRKAAGGPPEPARPTQAPKEKKERKGELHYLLEDNMKYDDNSTAVPRSLKRTREDPPPPPTPTPTPTPTPPPTKRAKAPPKESAQELTPTPPPPPPLPRSTPGPKSRKKPETKPAEPTKAPEPEKKIPAPTKSSKTKAKAVETPPKVKEVPKPEEPPKSYKCSICDAQLKNAQALSSHIKSHVPSFTKLSNACNPCGLWFPAADEAGAHHRYHRASTFPYHCRRCFADYRTLQLYNDHLTSQCAQWVELPDVRCEECWATFPTEPLRTRHRCPGRGGRPGGKCSNCSRTYATVRTLKKHESTCKPKKKPTGDLIADPDVLRRLKPMRVRITKCDDLFGRVTADYYDVSAVKPNYGLAKDYIYPYLKFPVKSEPLHRDSMVAIPVALKEELATDYTHWDSDDSDTESILRKVPSLSTLAIKKLFSKNCLGKVPRRRKKLKNETFENDNDFDNISHDINDIISSLDDMGSSSLEKKDLAARIKDIIGCFDDDDDGDLLNDEIKVDDKAEDKLESKSGDCNESTKEKIESNESKIDDNRQETSNDGVNLEVSDNVSQSDNLNENDNISRTQNDTENNLDDKMETDASLERIENKTDDNTDDSKEIDTSSHKTEIETENGSEDNKETEKSLQNTQNETENNSDDNKEIEKTLQNALSEIENNSNETDNNSNDNKVTENSLQNTQNETQNNLDDNNWETDITLQKIVENDIEMADQCTETSRTATREPENVRANGITTENQSLEDHSKDNDENKETSKVNKESPIKHSIENLIGDTDKNPDKYISEVISSLEDIINRKPRNEEINKNHELNGQNVNVNDISNSNMDVDGNKRISDQDKITLEDLLPTEDKPMELDNISDEDFDFDAC